jgi:hypothetical protein
VVGDIPSSLNKEERNSTPSQGLFGNEDVIQAPGSANGDGSRMFQEEHDIGDFPLDSLMMKPFL